MALLLALARNVPQAHASLTRVSGERSKFSGVELYEKTLNSWALGGSGSWSPSGLGSSGNAR